MPRGSGKAVRRLRAVETSKSGGENVLSRGGGASGACFGRELLFILFFQMYLTTDELGKRREDEEEEIDTYLKVIYLKTVLYALEDVQCIY